MADSTHHPDRGATPQTSPLRESDLNKRSVERAELRSQNDHARLARAMAKHGLFIDQSPSRQNNEQASAAYLKYFANLPKYNDDPHQGKTFLDLPPEMRNQIYRYCLVLKDPIEFTAGTYPHNQKKGPHRVLNMPKSDSDIPFAPGILRVSKEVNREAVSVLYGENNFVFRWGWVADRVFTEIGFDHLRHLRHVQITSAEGSKSSLLRVLSALKKAQHLETLTLVYRRYRALGEFLEEEIVECLRVLMRHLKKQLKDTASVEEVIGVVQWKHDPLLRWPSQGLAREKLATVAFGDRVAKLLRELLK